MVCEKTVIVKLFESRDGKNNTAYEINQYRAISDPSPCLGVNAYLWNVPVLVMKEMKKIGKEDDYIEVGIQILQQFPALHRFTTFSDAKPRNFMKDPDEKTPQGKPRYQIIDLGGCARERMGIGFRRRTSTRNWCVQKNRNGFTTAKHDLLEFGHVLTAIKYCNEHNTNKYPSLKKRTFSGRLKRYMEYVDKIDEMSTPHGSYGPHYKALIEILQSGGKSKSYISRSSKKDKLGEKSEKKEKCSRSTKFLREIKH